jgi:RimJ/RimL family protein N-acetyltransferase
MMRHRADESTQPPTTTTHLIAGAVTASLRTVRTRIKPDAPNMQADGERKTELSACPRFNYSGTAQSQTMAFTSCPTLLTRRLHLIPLSGEHLEYEIQLDSDPEVVRFIGNGKPRSREQIEQLHRGRIARGVQVPGLGFWAGFLRASSPSGLQLTESDSFVGFWILTPPKPGYEGSVDGQAELGYRLMRKYWRQGLAKEGARELLRYGFQDFGLQRVFAETMAVNQASRATMLSVGLRFERSFYEEFEEMIPGSEEGEVEYAITRGQWQMMVQSCRSPS